MDYVGVSWSNDIPIPPLSAICARFLPLLCLSDDQTGTFFPDLIISYRYCGIIFLILCPQCTPISSRARATPPKPPCASAVDNSRKTRHALTFRPQRCATPHHRRRNRRSAHESAPRNVSAGFARTSEEAHSHGRRVAVRRQPIPCGQRAHSGAWQLVVDKFATSQYPKVNRGTITRSRSSE